MPRRPGVDGAPNTYLARGGTWPAGPFRASTPISVFYAAQLAVRLRAAMDKSGETTTDLLNELGFARSTIHALLTGRKFPDFHVLAVLEQHFGTALWPDGEFAKH